MPQSKPCSFIKANPGKLNFGSATTSIVPQARAGTPADICASIETAVKAACKAPL